MLESRSRRRTEIDQAAPAYLNAVVRIETTLEPAELLAAVAAIEAAHGRVREVRWGNRTLDIDIVTYGDLRKQDPELTLPHPRAAERSFVLVPWLEIEPDASYADTIERALYNTVIASMSRDGRHFFYVNPLEVWPQASLKNPARAHVKPVRQPWFVDFIAGAVTRRA